MSKQYFPELSGNSQRREPASSPHESWIRMCESLNLFPPTTVSADWKGSLRQSWLLEKQQLGDLSRPSTERFSAKEKLATGWKWLYTWEIKNPGIRPQECPRVGWENNWQSLTDVWNRTKSKTKLLIEKSGDFSGTLLHPNVEEYQLGKAK